MTRAIIALGALALVMASASQGAGPIVHAAVEPAAPLFGDTFAYVVDVEVDESRVDGARIFNEVGPFTRVAPTRVTRSVANGVARITVTEKIACLTARCIPGAPGTAVAIPHARVTLDGVGAAGPPVVVWVRSRVSGDAVRASEPVFRRPAGLPPATVRLDPGRAQAGLALGGIVLLFVGILVIVVPLRRWRPAAAPSDRTDPVVRAVRLLRESAARDSPDRRRAASLVSRVIGEGDLAVDAARVAWSRGDPGPPDAATLADRVERTTGTRA